MPCNYYTFPLTKLQTTDLSSKSNTTKQFSPIWSNRAIVKNSFSFNSSDMLSSRLVCYVAQQISFRTQESLTKSAKTIDEFLIVSLPSQRGINSASQRTGAREGKIGRVDFSGWICFVSLEIFNSSSDSNRSTFVVLLIFLSIFQGQFTAI